MTITPWQLYWILRLDTISGTLLGLAIAAGIFWFVPLLIGLIMKADGATNLAIFSSTELVERAQLQIQKGTSIARYSLRLLPIFLCLLTASVLCPTTKQMAAVIIIPKVANSEFVQKDVPAEAKELYGLCKKWLETQCQDSSEEKQGTPE